MQKTIWKLGIVLGLLGLAPLGHSMGPTATVDQMLDVWNGWEISVPETKAIKDQGKFPYCGLYAMSSFLELWANGSKPTYSTPLVDPAFLGLGYNRLVGAANMGTHPIFLTVSTQLFGAVPIGSRFSGEQQWPLKGWEKTQMRLIDKEVTDPLLVGTYTNSIYGTTKFTAQQYFKKALYMDFSHMVGFVSNDDEKHKAGKPSDEVHHLRFKTYGETATVVAQVGQKMGLNTSMYEIKPGVLYTAVRKQLYKRRPVFLSINAGLVTDKFSKYRVIAGTDLVKRDTGHNYMHAVVALAHCDKYTSDDRVCRRFGPYMQKKGIKECVAIQNSWGPEVHDKGYFCLGPKAFVRVAKLGLLSAQALKE